MSSIRTSVMVAGQALHGLCYAFFFTAGYLYIDEHSPREGRAGAQQIYTILIMGLGYFAGHSIAGRLGEFFLIDPVLKLIDFPKFWSVPAVSAVVTGILLLIFFKPEPSEPCDKEEALQKAGLESGEI